MYDITMTSCSKCGSFILEHPDQILGMDEQALLKANDLGEHALKLHSDTIAMDAQIIRMEYLIDKLRKQRALACRNRNRYAPVARLPVELISEIFRCALAVTGDEEFYSARSTTLPLILGKVSSEWRNVAWGLSELWSSFHCRVSKTRYSTQAVLLQQWIARSDGRPLEIRITLEDEDSWNMSGITSTHIIDALLPHCRLWHSLDLVLPETWYNKLQYVTEKLDILTSVKIRPPGYIFILKPLIAFSDAPRLHRISSSHYYMHDLHFPWLQLTEATLATASMDEALEFLRRCPNLISCRFEDLNHIEGEFSMDAVLNTKMQHLFISLHLFATLSPFIDALTLPDLCFLNLTVAPSHPNPLNIIEQLIERSECPLKTIQITGISIQEQDIINFLVYNNAVSNVNNTITIKDQDSVPHP